MTIPILEQSEFQKKIKGRIHIQGIGKVGIKNVRRRQLNYP